MHPHTAMLAKRGARANPLLRGKFSLPKYFVGNSYGALWEEEGGFGMHA